MARIILAKFKYIYWLVEFLLSERVFLFDWDDGNSGKSEDKHGVTIEMVESSFEDSNLLALGEQYQPVVNEDRYGIIAKSICGELLFVCFTIRDAKLRPISARPANKKERSIYDN